MAYYLVKCLYGRTNKHNDVTKQIGQHVRQLERAQHAANQNKANISDDLNGPGMMVQNVTAWMPGPGNQTSFHLLDYRASPCFL
jgi:hypothetical protein